MWPFGRFMCNSRLVAGCHVSSSCGCCRPEPHPGDMVIIPDFNFRMFCEHITEQTWDRRGREEGDLRFDFVRCQLSCWFALGRLFLRGLWWAHGVQLAGCCCGYLFLSVECKVGAVSTLIWRKKECGQIWCPNSPRETSHISEMLTSIVK
jgi:hypothetical protein